MPRMPGNLSIRSKLLALLAVPVAGTALLGGTGLAAAAGERARAAEERRVAAVLGQAVAAVHELQEERVRAAATAAGEGATAQQALADRRRRVDRALAAYRAGAAGLAPTGDPALDQAFAAAAARLDHLAVVRAEVDRQLVSPERVVDDHDALVAALLGVTRGLAGRLEGPEPARVARLLLALAAAKEATGQERALLAGSPPPPDPAPAPAGRGVRAAGSADQAPLVRLAAAAAVARSELNGVRAAAGDRLAEVDRALGEPGVRRLRRLELALLEPAPNRPTAEGDPAAWRAGLGVRAATLRRVERQVAADLAEASRAWLDRRQRRLRDQLALAAGVALASLAAAVLLLGVAAGRREGAPAAPVLGLAGRGRALADRQLRLLQELVTDEPDPHRRQGLLGVDHLAKRLRRTAETLLAMAGPEPARPGTASQPLDALLWAAVAEAEPGGARRGGRVDLLATGEVAVPGPAAVDLAHLLAELLDNAAAFSSPTAPISVTAAADGDAYLVQVTDHGLGMTDQELAWANQRLAARAEADPAGGAAGDRLGLLIVAGLASRNGFGVRLGRSPAGGVTAAVRLPAALLDPRSPVRQTRPDQGEVRQNPPLRRYWHRR
jgi:signal transduction histidine kinase